VSASAFEDLLGQSIGSKKDEPKTIKEMRHDQQVKEIDPDKLKVRLSGKEIDALLVERAFHIIEG